MTGESTEAQSQAPQQPLLRVVSGNPTPEELAALVAVLAAASGASDEGEAQQDSNDWGAPSAMHRTSMPAPGPDSWRQLGRR